jgi:tripartite-type tricarboxylate transporter receptor subunit TctC
MLFTAPPRWPSLHPRATPGASDVRERLTALGTEPTVGTPEQFAETIKADTTRWAKVVSDAGIRIE